MRGYCVKCRAMKPMSDVRTHRTGGRVRYSGRCPTCGTKMSKFGKG